MRRVIVSPPEPLNSVRSEIPRALAEVVEKALAKEPKERYQSAADLAEALQTARDATGVRRSIDRLRRDGSPKVAAVVLALLVVATVSFFVGNRLLGRSIAFDERDWLLVADVVNETGDEGFTLALKSALETDLRQSRHVNIYDEGRARNTLRMMRRDPTSPIDLEVGAELCRFAGVRALLVPRIDAVGDVFILQASLVEPTTGRTADHIRLTAKGRDEVLLETIDELTRTVRRRLGESLSSIAETDPPLVQYTTSSWEAQRMLALGSQAWAGGRHQEAERCFKLALEEDPDFATARGSLGLLYMQFMGKTEEGRQQLERAFADADEVSRREYLILRAIHSQFVEGNLESALADYQLVIELYPDLVQPINNSARILQALGRDDEAEELYLRALEIDPDSAAPLWNLWEIYVLRNRMPVAGERMARELVRIQPAGPWARHALGYALVALRRFDEAEEEMRAVLELDPTHVYATNNLAHLLFRRGAFSEAEAMYRTRWQVSQESEWVDRSSYDSLRLAITLKNLDRWDEAWMIIEDEFSGFRQYAEGRDLDHADAALGSCILAALGRTEEATEQIRQLAVDPDATANGLYGLAKACALIGDLDRAEEMLVRAMDAGWGDPYFILIDPLLYALQDRPIIDELAPY
jgi:tetratricopeptide (TPR) repeat protein